MKGFACLVVVVASSLGLGACQLMGRVNSSVQGKAFEFNLQQDCPNDLTIHVGDVIFFSAPENITTGYQWTLVQPLQNFKVEENLLQKMTPVGIVGVGSVKSYRFTALKSGQDNIELIYARHWEAPTQSASKWQCRINVTEK